MKAVSDVQSAPRASRVRAPNGDSILSAIGQPNVIVVSASL